MAMFTCDQIPTKRMYLLAIVATILFSFQATALNFVTGSKCESVCADSVAGNIHDDVRCLDDEFDVAPASLLKTCVTCQLASTAVDPITKVTDVQWGLFHLRYILANCMFGYPESRVSISSPCQVSCKPLDRAVEFGISNSTNTTAYSADLGFCTGGQFDDTTINNCAFCYSFIPQQIILGNFLQALHIACFKAPTVGKSFSVNGDLIFNRSTIAGPTADTASSGSSGLTGTSLILAIVLPILGGIFVLAGICCCCWYLSRKGRMRMAANGRMTRFHDNQHIQDFSPMSPMPMTPKGSPPQPMYMWNEPPQEMHSISALPKMPEHRVTEIAELPGSRQDPSHAQQRWPQFNRNHSGLPLMNSEHAVANTAQDNHTVVSSESRDSNLHEQYIGGGTRGSPPIGIARTQDGSVSDISQNGWGR